MSLPKILLQHAPTTSWWCQPSREAFIQAEQRELPRLRLIAPYVQAGFEQPGDTRMSKLSQPTRERGAE